MDKILTIAKEHFKNATEVPLESVDISDEVRRMCEQNKCGLYGKNWTCPPAVETLDEFRKEMEQYDSFIVVYRVYPLESSFNFKAMKDAAADFNERVLQMEKELEGDCPQLQFAAGIGHGHLQPGPAEGRKMLWFPSRPWESM